MIYKTHISFAIVLSEPIVYTLLTNDYINNLLDFFIFISILSFAAIFPDIDEPHSKVSRYFPFNILSFILSIFVKHRGFTHNFCGILLFSILPLFISFYILPLNILLITVFPWSFGYIFHIFGDALTKSGIRNFFCGKWFSMKKQFTFVLAPYFLRFKTNSIIESIINFSFMFIIFTSIYFGNQINLFENIINSPF